MTGGKKENKLGHARERHQRGDLSPTVHRRRRSSSGDEGRVSSTRCQVLDAGPHRNRALSVGLAQGAYEGSPRLRARAAISSASRSPRSRRFNGSSPTTRRASRRRGWLTYRARLPQGHRRSDDAESSMAKLFASETAVKAADDCVQIHGGYGFREGLSAEKYFRDVKLLTIGEGTSEIQRLVIARICSGSDHRPRAAACRRHARRPVRQGDPRRSPAHLAGRGRVAAGADLIRSSFRTGRAQHIGSPDRPRGEEHAGRIG
jgi:hypothetical protein